MNVFAADTDVSLTVPLLDDDGNALNVSALSYRVTDENDVEVVALTEDLTFSEGSTEASITVPAANNALAAGVARGLRSVVLTCLVDGNTVYVQTAYTIMNADPLVVGLNSFMTYAQAEFVAAAMPNLDGWAAAGQLMRMSALQEARSHINQLSFVQLGSNAWGQDSLNFVPEGSVDTNYIGRQGFAGNLDLLTPDQFKQLPPKFIEALKKAQLAEADMILSGDTIEQKRRDGLTQDNIGESRQSFRQSKPLQLPVGRRALGYLSLWVTFAKRIGRG